MIPRNNYPKVAVISKNPEAIQAITSTIKSINPFGPEIQTMPSIHGAYEEINPDTNLVIIIGNKYDPETIRSLKEEKDYANFIHIIHKSVASYQLVDGLAVHQAERLYDFSSDTPLLSKIELFLQCGKSPAIIYGEEPAVQDMHFNFNGTSKSIVYRSQIMSEFLRKASLCAKKNKTVLITGETGTGKNLLAEYIYTESQRSNGPWRYVNLHTLNPSTVISELFGHEKGSFTGAEKKHVGLLEQANGGTILLDEIGDLKPDAQVYLLNFLQGKTIRRMGNGQDEIKLDVRVIAATNQNLIQKIQQGDFRKDLYYRLNQLPLEVPPLRERREDIGALTEYIIGLKEITELDFTPKIKSSAIDLIKKQNLEGNVRELESIIGRIATELELRGEEQITRDIIKKVLKEGTYEEPVTKEDLADYLRGFNLTLGKLPTTREMEETLIDVALEKHDGIQTRAAKEIGISARALRYKIKARENS